MRDTFVDSLMRLADADKNVMLVTGDLGFGVLKPFWEKYPDQFINAGIAEQAMTGLAAGLSLAGKTVFTYSIGNFPTLRCVEQVRNDCAYHDANVKIICIGAGFTYGSLGMSHHATEDVSIMRALPGITLFTPSDPLETQRCMELLYETPGTCYMRLGRGGETVLHADALNFNVAEAVKVLESEGVGAPAHKQKSIAFFVAGSVAENVCDAANELEKHSIKSSVYTFPTVKPLDEKTIIQCASEYDQIVTVEEHNVIGGLGGAVAEVLSSIAGSRAYLTRIGLEDTYSMIVGSQDYLRDRYGMSSTAIVDRILNQSA